MSIAKLIWWSQKLANWANLEKTYLLRFSLSYRKRLNLQSFFPLNIFDKVRLWCVRNFALDTPWPDKTVSSTVLPVDEYYSAEKNPVKINPEWEEQVTHLAIAESQGFTSCFLWVKCYSKTSSEFFFPLYGDWATNTDPLFATEMFLFEVRDNRQLSNK